MKPHWVSSSFQPLSGAFGNRGLRVLCLYVFLFLYDVRTYRVGHGHVKCAYLIPHISKFSSKFCSIDCLTLYPRRAVVCRPRQTRVDVHVLVVTIQGYCFSIMPFQEPEQKLLSKKKLLPKNMLLSKNMLLPKNMSFCQPYRLP